MNKKNLKVALFFTSFSMMFFSCSSDDTPDVLPTPDKKATVTGIESNYTTDRCKVLSLTPVLDGFESNSFQWKLSNNDLGIKDSLLNTNKDLDFLEYRTGNYELTFSTVSGDSIITKTTEVVVNKEETAYSAYLTKVFDFLPAVGQYTNTMPKYEEGDTYATMVQKAEDAIKGEKPSMISLGGFGGYVVFGFDHTIKNVPGKRDFRVLGNAFFSDEKAKSGSCEPGIIMVAYDKNKNGKPDDDEWYEIAGSEHAKSKVIYNYEITYYKPEVDESGAYSKTIKWTDNKGNSGVKVNNASRSYYPNWVTEDQITYKGTLLPDNAFDTTGKGFWSLFAYDYGYADNYPNTNDESAIDINWAIDAAGNRANLPGIDFIKVYTGVNQEAGWLGEVSSEVAGAYDLHLDNIVIPTRLDY